MVTSNNDSIPTPVVQKDLLLIGGLMLKLDADHPAASVLWPISDPLTALAAGTVLGAPASLVPHAAKSGLRAASTAVTGGLANPVLSLIEDVTAFILFVAAVVVPVMVVALLLLTAVLVSRRLLRRARPAVRTA